MAFYDDLDENVSGVGKGWISKIRGVFERFKLYRTIRAEEKKQKELFMQMGEFYYHTYGEQADGQMKIWCDAVWNNKTVIMQCRGQVRRLQGAFYCPNCNKQVPSGSKYCNHCGARVVSAQPISIVSTPPFSAERCPGCGKAVEKGQQFCPNCGGRLPEKQDTAAENGQKTSGTSESKEVLHDLKDSVRRFVKEKAEEAAEKERQEEEAFSEIDAAEQVLEAEAVEVIEPEEGQEIQEEETEKQEEPQAEGTVKQEEEKDGKSCPECGAVLEEGQNFCSKCGIKILYEAPVEPQEESKAVICPECKRELKDGEIFCPECGMKLR